MLPLQHALTGICSLGHIKGVRDTVWAALGDRHRRTMLDSLRGGDRSVGDLTQRVGLSQPATSKHLRVLREAGLVTVRKQAQQRIYTLVPRPMAELDAWLAPYRRLWNARLDALDRYLDETEQ